MTAPLSIPHSTRFFFSLSGAAWVCRARILNFLTSPLLVARAPMAASWAAANPQAGLLPLASRRAKWQVRFWLLFISVFFGFTRMSHWLCCRRSLVMAAMRRRTEFQDAWLAKDAPVDDDNAQVEEAAAVDRTGNAASIPAVDWQPASDTAIRSTRISPEELEQELHRRPMTEEEQAAARRRTQVMQNAEQAYEQSARGQDPYNYRPRRGLRIGADYQVDIPDLEVPEPGTSGSAASAAEQDAEMAVEPETNDKLARVSQCVQQLTEALQAAETTAAADCLGVLLRIVQRILAQPDDARVRRIDASSRSFVTNTRASPSMAIQLLEELGFTAEPDGVHWQWTRNDPALLAHGRDLLQRVVIPGA